MSALTTFPPWLPALRHRLIVNFEAEAEVTSDHVLEKILTVVPRDSEASKVSA